MYVVDNGGERVIETARSRRAEQRRADLSVAGPGIAVANGKVVLAECEAMNQFAGAGAGAGAEDGAAGFREPRERGARRVHGFREHGLMQVKLREDTARDLVTSPRLVFRNDPTGGFDVTKRTRVLVLIRVAKARCAALTPAGVA